jgi:hypothetical protein
MSDIKTKVEERIKFHKEQVETLHLSLNKVQQEIQKAIATNNKTETTALNAAAALLLQQNIKKHEGSIESLKFVLDEIK